MKQVKVFYPDIPNMGDQLNKSMIEDVFGVEVENSSPEEAELFCIGSILHRAFFSKRIDVRIKQKILLHIDNKKHYIWSTGFKYKDNTFAEHMLFKDCQICAVRGELTKKRLESLLGRKICGPVGDGGLLVSRWQKSSEKKYSVGIIPHYYDKGSPLINELKKYYGNDAVIINIQNDPADVIRLISSCEYIVSSSLHGLIVADSYHIPNLHIEFGEYEQWKKGGGFKYSDYYSAFALEDSPVKIDVNNYPPIDYIQKSYKIPFDLVERKKEELYYAFPR